MTKKITLLLLLATALFSTEIPTQKASLRAFGKSVALNAQIIQLSNAQQSIMSLVSGHIEKYYVQEGEHVKKGARIALIESINLSQKTANFISLKKQFIALDKNYKATESLYKKGMASMQDLNLQSIQKNAMQAQIASLESQLKTLGINTKTLKKASADYVLYAHSEGDVSAILQALHSVINENTAIVSLVKSQAYFVKSYLPVEYAQKVAIGEKLVIKYAGEEIVTHISQILPKLDSVTQRVVILSPITQKIQHLFINTYVEATLFFNADKEYVAVEKSALSFFNNEWVVFVKLNIKDEAIPYEIRVIKKVMEDEKYVAVEGLKVGEVYVSNKSYYVKSAFLKSSLGDGD